MSSRAELIAIETDIIVLHDKHLKCGSQDANHFLPSFCTVV